MSYLLHDIFESGEVTDDGKVADFLFGEPKDEGDDESEDDDVKTHRYAQVHAPSNMVIAGKMFKGGQFIPGDVAAQATPQQQKMLGVTPESIQQDQQAESEKAQVKARKDQQAQAKAQGNEHGHASTVPHPDQPNKPMEPPRPWTPAHQAILDKVGKAFKSGSWAHAPEQHKEHYAAREKAYKHAMKEVLSRMPEGMSKSIATSVKEFRFVPSLKAIGEAIGKHGFMLDDQEAVAGFVTHNRDMSTSVTLDGGLDPADGVTDTTDEEGLRTQDIYAHELAHCLDWKDEHSGGDDWGEIWEAEMRSGDLSDYAKFDQTEGFAEFGRLVCSGMPTGDIAKTFPQAFGYFKKMGWV